MTSSPPQLPEMKGNPRGKRSRWEKWHGYLLFNHENSLAAYATKTRRANPIKALIFE